MADSAPLTQFLGSAAFFETWYPLLAPFTPPSRCVPLTPDEQAVVLVRMYDHILEDDPYYAVLHDRPPTPGLDETAVLAGLRAKLTRWLDGQPVFFRTNIASPKDVGLGPIRTADDVLTRLLRSFRVYRLCRFLGDQPRGWDPQRFIRSRPMTTTSWLSMCAALSLPLDWIGLDSAVLDVGRSPTGWWAIEINPFTRATDLCLFAGTNLYATPLPAPEIRYWRDPYTIGRLSFREGVWTPRSPLPALDLFHAADPFDPDWRHLIDYVEGVHDEP